MRAEAMLGLHAQQVLQRTLKRLVVGPDSFAMPQPLRPGSISFDFRRTAVLQRPKLAPYIVAISMHWNEMESRMGVFLASLMGGEAKTIIRVFLALNTDGGRKATIDTVTALKLSHDDLQKFQGIQKTIGARYSERNKAVHGVWGISPEYPDDLLWYDHRETVAMFPELMSRLGAGQQAERQAILEEQNKNIRVYKEQDFKDILARFEAAYSDLESFTRPFVSPLFARITP
jgi:hypothetical protein